MESPLTPMKSQYLDGLNGGLVGPSSRATLRSPFASQKFLTVWLLPQ